MPTLPRPNAAAQSHSEALMRVIHEEISRTGYISFARYMELALYAPGLGYYSAGTHKIGKAGDFVTAPEISPLFGKCLAKQCEQILSSLGTGDILELGAGSGKLASDLLHELEKLGSLPEHYYILEVSADLRQKQAQYLDQHCPHLFSRVQWLDTLPKTKIKGVILANEVLDALPIHCFRIDGVTIKERCVTTIGKNQLDWLSAPPTTPELTKHVAAILEECPLDNNYESEVNLMLPAWVHSIADSLDQGLLLLLDYGFGRREYYHPDRNGGTLMCYYQHQKHTNPFIMVGLQDITAHVDFTAVAESAVNSNLALAGYTTQSSFLLACGILELASHNTLTATEEYQQNQAIKLLTLPSQMGELIKAIGFTRNIDIPLLGFSLHDRRRDL